MNSLLIDKDGNQFWFDETNEWHRPTGPAIIWVDGYQSWWINDIQCYTNKSFQKAANLSDEDMLAMILKYGDVGE